jgi:iron(III) transport system permease protein
MFFLCLGALPILFGFVLPTLYLIDQAIITSARHLDWRDLGYAVYDSMRLALIASFSVAVIAVILLYPHRVHPDRTTTLQLRLASYGYAVPGVILGLAILIPMGTFDNFIDGLLRQSFGISSGLLMTGSAGILVFAYLVRFASVGIGIAGSGYDKISRHLDLAARSLGRSRFTSFMLVPTRINAPAIAAAALLVFVDVVKELPLTLILRPLGIDTLATRIYENASIGQFELASVKALILLLISASAVILVIGRQVKSDL